jgi:uncharacterized RDD family membrane protein YckC
LLAAAVDVLLVAILTLAVNCVGIGLVFMARPRAFEWPSDYGWIVALSATVVAFVYLSVAWSLTGRTLGSALVGVRVVTQAGKRADLGRACARSALYLIAPIGLLTIPFDRQHRSVQDLLVGTRVYRDPP